MVTSFQVAPGAVSDTACISYFALIVQAQEALKLLQSGPQNLGRPKQMSSCRISTDFSRLDISIASQIPFSILCSLD